MASQIQQNLVEKNKAYASSFTKSGLALPPAKKYAVVTCMDARIDPSSAYGISLDDAHAIRNAGGSARNALRSLVISEQLLGTNEILLVKHPGCGMLTFKNEDVKGVVEKNLGSEAAAEVKSWDFLPFSDLEEAVREDARYSNESKLIPEYVGISGWVYEVETGKVRTVEDR
ncbi:beta carbonic anhydrase clade D [Cryomyces antarcticus]|uniref:Carbonic anhydrase n=1 Tax=Cryomyces antarcticus TaxID=329879 RepID=A0ABR0LPR3_9PEZI|nr:hypothetical protein LTR39_001718 [Cryomyces antarcticus]KAK5201590.1 hypothetical protein LTR16_002139 [Cryomyces antarcticus]